jgi:hypothetical protein
LRTDKKKVADFFAEASFTMRRKYKQNRFNKSWVCCTRKIANIFDLAQQTRNDEDERSER